MNGDITYISKTGQINGLSNFEVSAIKKGGGAAPRRYPIGLKFFWEVFLVM